MEWKWQIPLLKIRKSSEYGYLKIWEWIRSSTKKIEWEKSLKEHASRHLNVYRPSQQEENEYEKAIVSDI